MDFDLIIPGLYLGNMPMNIALLAKLDIKQILSLGFDYEITDKISCKFIALNDEPTENIYLVLDDTFECIHQALQENGNIYIHCIAGVSRSPTIVIAYLMRLNQWSLAESLDFVKSKRSMADPNFGFIEQLRLYQNTGFKVDTTSSSYNRFLILSKFRKNYDLSWENSENIFKPISKQGQVLKCKNCRFLLISEPEDILYHSSNDDMIECGLFYLNPALDWIPLEDGVLQGKIDCPSCHYKLGKYNWSGMQCTCGKWIVPGFSVQRSKVDLDFRPVARNFRPVARNIRPVAGNI